MKIIINNKRQYEERLEELADLKKAKKKILEAQSYTIGSSQLNRASLKEISQEIVAYEDAIAKYEANGTTKRRTGRIVPIG